MLLVTSASPQISDVRPHMRQKALFVTSRAACRWNGMLYAQENVYRPLAAIAVATELTSTMAHRIVRLHDREGLVGEVGPPLTA